MRLRAHIPAHARGAVPAAGTNRGCDGRCPSTEGSAEGLGRWRGRGSGSAQRPRAALGTLAAPVCKKTPASMPGLIHPCGDGACSRLETLADAAGPRQTQGAVGSLLALDWIRSQFSVACGAIALDTTSQAAAARHCRWRAQARKFHLQQPSLALKQWVPEDTVVDPAGNTRCGVVVQESHRNPGS